MAAKSDKKRLWWYWILTPDRVSCYWIYCSSFLICVAIVSFDSIFFFCVESFKNDGEDILYWRWICWWSNNSSDRTQMSTHVYCRSRWHLCPTYQRMEQWSGSPSTSLALKTSSCNAETKTSSSVTGADLLLLSFTNWAILFCDHSYVYFYRYVGNKKVSKSPSQLL